MVPVNSLSFQSLSWNKILSNYDFFFKIYYWIKSRWEKRAYHKAVGPKRLTRVDKRAHGSIQQIMILPFLI